MCLLINEISGRKTNTIINKMFNMGYGMLLIMEWDVFMDECVRWIGGFKLVGWNDGLCVYWGWLYS